ncbi:MAG: TAT-variant-translocated molybdopterin oxidoreductase [Acidobacteria bacterium]|nr:TAT-variant-translocated molybdopterin oxidoreductase [Acidobacteriota bacterium]
MDLTAIRSRMAGTEGRLYWRSLGELADTPAFREYLHREFPEQASEWNDPKGRRDFLKLMGASLALAGVGACTKQPTEAIIPYVRQPEDIVPGRPLFFASAIVHRGYAHPVLVESHMGRPTKIEGNPDHPASLGAADSFTQAALLDLYDPDRAKTVTYRGEVRSWSNFLTGAQGALTSQKSRQGAGLRFLTGPITSPSLAELMATILRDYPQAKWHQFDPAAMHGAPWSGASEYATIQHPVYHFDKADVIVSLDADFIGGGPGNVRYQRDFADRRRITDDRKEMNRLYTIESTPTLTGAKADHRLPVKASEVENIARELSLALGSGVAGQFPPAIAPAPPTASAQASVPQPGSPEIAKWLAAIVKDLNAHRGRSLIVPGDYQPAAVHQLARIMNAALGNTGATVTYAAPVEAMPVDRHASLAELASAMDAGQVEVLIIVGGNPVFAAPADLKFGERLQKVGLVAYWGTHVDETAHVSHWNLPAAHPLESWGDARAYDGTVTLMQPLVAPLYEGRSPHELLALFSPQGDRRGMQIVKDYWTRAFAGAGGWTMRDGDGQAFKDADTFWRRVVHDGFIAGSAVTAGGPGTSFTPAPAVAPPKPAPGTPGVAGAARPATGGGAPSTTVPAPSAPSAPPAPTSAVAPSAPSAPTSAVAPAAPPPAPAPAAPSSGGLEIIFRPDPTIWDGSFANNGWLQELPKPLTKLTWDTSAWISPRLAASRELHNGDVIELRYRGNTAKMPVFIVPGHPQESVTVFFGYGRRMAGRVGNAIAEAQQFNAYLLRTSDAPWFGHGLEISKTGDSYPLATTQEHHAMEGRAPVRVATLEEYKHDPAVIAHQGHTPPKTLTMYPEHAYDGYKWGMAIDLTSCTGCGACTIACVAENNIPVVGKEQVARGREMHWIRVDHYFEGSPDNPQSYHQPIPCMQCENAPCEVVCPVAATSHSSEGLNDMTYNRCVGTRYCSNNCPYKVRRFNFLLYSDWYTESLHPMRNPDVTVRSRGIMEKCTYCVQRINHARVDAKREDRQIRDGEIVTACQATCPADAIVFGDLNDANSRVSKLKTQQRNYGVLEDLNTRPRTTYLAAIRNPNPELGSTTASAQTERH